MSAVQVRDLPGVATFADTVVVELTGSQAKVLGRVLVHYSTLVAQAEAAETAVGYEREVWDHTAVSLFQQGALLRGHPVEVVDVHTTHVTPGGKIIALPVRSAR